jgi:hypothetical protein
LTEASAAVNPISGDAVEEDCCFSSFEQVVYPSTPFIREAPISHDFCQVVPSNAIEGFKEIQFQNNGGQFLL